MKRQNNWKVPLPKVRRDQQGNRPPGNRQSRQAYFELMAGKAADSNTTYESFQEKDKRLSLSYYPRQSYEEALIAKSAQQSNTTCPAAGITEKSNHRLQSPSATNSIMPKAAELNVTAAPACTHSTPDDSPPTYTNNLELDIAEEGMVSSCRPSNETSPFTTNNEAEEEFTSVQPGAYFVRGLNYASTTSSVDRSDLDDDEETEEAFVLEDPPKPQEISVLDAEIAGENTDPQYRARILESLKQGREDNVILADHVEREGAKRRRRTTAIACACLAVVAIVVGTSLGISSAAGGTPDFTPPPLTPAPTLPAHCFRSHDELLEAVDNYLEDNSNSTSVAMEYGWPIGNWCVSLVTNFSHLFSANRIATARLFNEDLNDWDMSSATTLESMFNNAETFNGNVSSWDTSSVTNMMQTFFGASSFNIDISSWNVSSVTDMSGTFAFATEFNQDISWWDVSGVMNMWSMFQYSTSFNRGLSGWNVEKVTRFEAMFRSASAFNNNLSMWDVSSATAFNEMFTDAAAFNQSISNWNVGRVTTFSNMFQGAMSFDQPLSSWKVSNAVSMQSMFQGAASFNQELSRWDTSQVQDMSSMFHDAVVFDQDVSSWDISVVSDFSGMFSGASRFNQDLCAWGATMKLDAEIEGIFDGTICPTANVQVDLLGSPPGPFCNECL